MQFLNIIEIVFGELKAKFVHKVKNCSASVSNDSAIRHCVELVFDAEAFDGAHFLIVVEKVYKSCEINYQGGSLALSPFGV